MQPTVLVSWSGGIDSTSCLWQLLRDGVCVLAHHVELRSPDGRWRAEGPAVEAQRAWFAAHGMPIEYFKRTGFDYGDVAKYTRDINITAFTAGFILSGYPSVTAAVISSSADDARRQESDAGIQARRKQLTEIMAGRSLEWLTPNLHKSKREVMAEMPPDLLALCWYCRKPLVEQGKCKSRFVRCGHCRTCREVIAAESALARQAKGE